MTGRKWVMKVRSKSHRRKKATLKRYGNRCMYCGREKELTLEHLTPVSRGGTWHVENLGISCKKCNTFKGTRTHEEFCEQEILTTVTERVLSSKQLDLFSAV